MPSDLRAPDPAGDDVRWRLDSLFSGLDADDYRAARADLARRVDALEATLAEGGLDAPPTSVVETGPGGDDAEVSTWDVRERLIGLLDARDTLAERLSDVSVFLTGHVAVNAFDDAAQAEQSTLRRLTARLGAVDARITAWIGRLDLDALLAGRDAALAPYVHYLRRTQAAAQHLMAESEEDLAAALAPSGGDAWGKLHDDLAGRATVPFTPPGSDEPEPTGLARLRVLQAHADRAVRGRAYHAELDLLDTHAVAIAAAMNGVKGEVGTLAERRGWSSPLAAALFENGVSADALEALQTAVRASFPDLRRYLRAKARFLGVERLAWYDLLAPVQTGTPRSFTWPEAAAFVQARFAGFAPALEALARRAVDEGWIDVLPRVGKRNGAFCMGASGAQESRVMLNFGGGLDDVFTLAHELGHAFHNDAAYRAGRRPLQAVTPMTLAETASIFCETLVTDALLAESDDATRLAVLEQDLRSSAQLLIDIDSRFRLESGIFERRAERELSVAELDELMLAAQDVTYGDALDPNARHPRMWAQKPHYYSARRSFYNFPYTFGYLFGLGVFARYRAEPEGFAQRYENLLANTGQASVAELGRAFGIDVEDAGFWSDALEVTAARVRDYERLVDTAVAEGPDRRGRDRTTG
jgi:oligoendopeptidase F